MNTPSPRWLAIATIAWCGLVSTTVALPPQAETSRRPAPHALPGANPPALGPLQLTVAIHGQRIGAYPVEIDDPSQPNTLDRKLADVDRVGQIWATAYTPHARVAFSLRRDVPDGKPALRLRIDGPGLETERWIIADDLNHASISSRIAQWTATIHRRPDQIRQYLDQNDPIRQHGKALLVATRDGKHREVFSGVTDGQTLHLPGTDVNIKILRYLPWCRTDLETKETVNLGDKPINPALEVEVTTAGNTSKHLVYARVEARRAQEASAEKPPVELRFHQATSPLAGRPAFRLFIAPPHGLTMVTVLGEAANAIPLELGAVVQIPQTPYRFRIAEIVEHAAIAEEWSTTEQSSGTPALQVRIVGADAAPSHTFWITQGSVKRFALPAGFAELRFARAHLPNASIPPQHPPIQSSSTRGTTSQSVK